ncbi:MCE family protein [Nocardioides sp. WS12]|uniref:MCE family protein n=1 Tax=Nocardioides sp. WS12 TaxID=2486272 RepID=UPI0015FA5FB6|nr:MCE family protein [Nocardioides sp. WS12]
MTSSRTVHARHHTQFLGALGLAVIIMVSAFLIATYQRVFADVVTVTVQTDRGGLLLDKGARVRMSGVPVGAVTSTKVQEDGTVAVGVSLDADKAALVPADAVATIRATTAFGSKFVDLRTPAERTAKGAIADGDVIKASGVTVEVNDVFQHGLSVLEAVDPVKLNSTLTAAATALEGRGEKFGQFFTDWDSYLTAVEPHLDELETDLSASPDVFRTYADVAPQFIETGDNFATTSETLVADQAKFDALLKETPKAADSISRFLNAVERPLGAFNTQLLPFSALGAEYAPEFGCLIKSVRTHIEIIDKAFGKTVDGEHYLYAKTGFLPSINPYTLEKNRPKLVTDVGPLCYREATAERPTVPHVDFDDGTAGTYSEANTAKPVGVGDNPLQLYSNLVDDWFGSEVLAKLFEARNGVDQ